MNAVAAATADSKHSHPIAPNLLERNFHADAPNRVWVTDVTCVWTAQGWLFLAAMLDLFSRRVVGWATSASNDTELAISARQQAVKSRQPPPGLVHHSDRGSRTRAATTGVAFGVSASSRA